MDKGGMERARPFRFVSRLPRTTVEEVAHQEQVYDKQVLLNEFWVKYCDRVGHAEWKPQEPDRDKWVTETWEEHEARKRRQPGAIDAFNQKVAERNEQTGAKAEARRSRARQVLDDIRKREDERSGTLLPVLHTLLVDFEEKREREQRQQRDGLEKLEQEQRKRIEDELRDAAFKLRELESEGLRQVRQMIEDRERADRERQRELEEAALRAEQEAEAERVRREEEERQRKKNEEEEAKRKEQEEKDRKARERREKLRAERERRKSLEEEAAQRRDSRRRSSIQRLDSSGKLGGTRRGSLAMQYDMRRDEAREKRLARQRDALGAYLERLRARVGEVAGLDAVHALLGEVADELGGKLLFDCAIYIALVQDGQLCYRFASPNCSPVLRAGKETLGIAAHPDCPTVKDAVSAKQTAVCPNCLADPPDGTPGIARVGTKEGRGPGDFFTTPIYDSSRGVAAVLSADTLNQLNRQQEAASLQDGEEDCYLGDPPLPAVKITDDMQDFLVKVAALLSEAFVKGMTPQVGDTRTVGDLYARVTEQVAALLGPAASCYIATLPRVGGDTFTVIAQNGLRRPPGGDVPAQLPNGHNNVIGKTLADKSAPSFALPSEEGKYSFFADERKDDTIKPYVGGAEKRGDFLLLVPILAQHKGALGVAGVLGVEAPAEAGLSDEQIAQIIAVARQLNERRPQLLRYRLSRQLAWQCMQWCHALSGVANVYISYRQQLLSDLADPGTKSGGGPLTGRLQYVAATPKQAWVVGKVLEEGEGVSMSVLDAEGRKPRHIPDISKEPAVKLLGGEGQGSSKAEGQLSVCPIVSRDGEALGAIYMDTVGWTEGKRNIPEAQLEMVANAGRILGALLGDIRSGKVVGDTDDGEQELQIETEFSAGPVRFLKKVWLHVIEQLLSMKKEELLEMAKYNSPPEAIPPVCAASFIITGAKPKSVNEWADCRKRIKHERIKKMATFDPTKGKPKGPFWIRGKKMIKGMSVDFVATKGSKPASLFFYWTYVNIHLRYAAVRLRKLHAQGELELYDADEPPLDDTATEVSTEAGSSMGDVDDPDAEEGGGDDEDGGDDAEN
eukprot:TRINITY_DN65515_c0_g1_i1.p1 TRINITY_DN65515_c0_g1~~TRINITY_DN65515_c0_g1_i1.p1  ORF type:complete len:1100 (+),score=502.13 TRINITY_DN65515_c0_g1_i1:81-3302(+)